MSLPIDTPTVTPSASSNFGINSNPLHSSDCDLHVTKKKSRFKKKGVRKIQLNFLQFSLTYVARRRRLLALRGH